MTAPPSEFERELRQLINRHNKENQSHTPDFVLANFLLRSLEAFSAAIAARDSWFGFNPWRPKPAKDPE